MSCVIKVQNLSKKYFIHHEKNQRYQYKTLRESFAGLGQRIFRRLSHPVSGNTVGSETEEFWALKDINFEIKQGERVGVIGPNGAGKSTLLKILSRITAPTTGRITIKGRVSSLLEVGTGFHPELTGRENIFLNGAILGMKKAEIRRRFDEIVAFAEIDKFLDTPVKRYSSGMHVRLAFAVAAHLEPDILIVDEVLAVGDAQFQRKCLGKMEEVGQEGRTVLFVSHNLGAIRNVTEKVILLTSGQIKGTYRSAEGVDTYMVTNVKKKTSKVYFPNEKQRYICVRSVVIGKGKENTEGVFEYQEHIPMRIQYQINKTIAGARFGCIIHNSEGVVLATCDTDTNPQRYAKRKPGLYSAYFEIPGKFLNQGFYLVSVTTGIPSKEVLDFKNQVISFSIVDRTSKLRCTRNESRAGTCFVEIPWNVDKLCSESQIL